MEAATILFDPEKFGDHPNGVAPWPFRFLEVVETGCFIVPVAFSHITSGASPVLTAVTKGQLKAWQHMMIVVMEGM